METSGISYSQPTIKRLPEGSLSLITRSGAKLDRQDVLHRFQCTKFAQVCFSACMYHHCIAAATPILFCFGIFVVLLVCEEQTWNWTLASENLYQPFCRLQACSMHFMFVACQIQIVESSQCCQSQHKFISSTARSSAKSQAFLFCHNIISPISVFTSALCVSIFYTQVRKRDRPWILG